MWLMNFKCDDPEFPLWTPRNGRLIGLGVGYGWARVQPLNHRSSPDEHLMAAEHYGA